MTVGERMKTLRKKRGISADTVAEAIGVSRSTIFRYERGDIDKVPADLLERIAAALHTNSGYLLGWSESDKPVIQTQRREESELTASERELIELYRRADESDRLAVNLILQKYADPAEQAPASAG